MDNECRITTVHIRRNLNCPVHWVLPQMLVFPICYLERQERNSAWDFGIRLPEISSFLFLHHVVILLSDISNYVRVLISSTPSCLAIDCLVLLSFIMATLSYKHRAVEGHWFNFPLDTRWFLKPLGNEWQLLLWWFRNK